MNTALIVVLAIVLGPIIGGLLTGIDRKITARLQGRFGPPIMQPFYDVFKLLGKEKFINNKVQIVYVITYIFFAMLSFVLFVLGQDLIAIIFVLTVGGGAMVMGALSVRSPYSQIGSQREILQMLAYDPLLIITAFGMFVVTGSFKVSEIVNYQIQNNTPLLYVLPLVFIVLIEVLSIKMRKSPFDISAGQHAHQELVRGVHTEFSGPYLALIEVAHWYELMLALGFVAIFFASNWYIAAALVIVMYLLEIILDNTTARLTWRWMLKSAWGFGIVLCAVNVIALYFI
ncbi:MULTISPECIES: respiratory chain complex I subunit 1 family protein [Pelotomaculum]|uniref:respiratory chain complex I subunit 1 family protein n=1 Tax=Pelotomaculum TaxID=191373 RepID=UPI0010669E26|nr:MULTISPECIES: complex I subunit 1 family protein [Pelotomaculum]